MGIDIYMRWDNITEEEEQNQYCGWDCHSGHLGYLREAYHGEPYATKIFVAEAFESVSCMARIPARVLYERLEYVGSLAIQRDMDIYNCSREVAMLSAKTYADFASLASRKELETGSPVNIMASY